MKPLYKVAFERNSERIKDLRHQYVQRVMELEANQVPREIICVDEAGFNLVKRCCRGRNIIGKRATVTVPGQRGGNITMCTAISDNGALLHKCEIGPYNTDRLLLFLEDLHQRLVPEVERRQVGDHLPIYVITWDNVAFHHPRTIPAWGVTTLDLLYADIKDEYISSLLPPLGRSDHNLVHLVPDYPPVGTKQQPVERLVKQWSEEVSDRLRDCFETTDWEALCTPHGTDTDSMTKCITD
ncbi:uncharacterized protein LOC116680796 [Etheostoma spectabile]|uniref:uncharacterized protein LOC116680796 n=1 Tax=Etheostoma spectabile TaxID=54343 RepID=UPI0013AE87C8|nr:uncharacterized protein LOC116680796 [Etheostoma spectabile]